MFRMNVERALNILQYMPKTYVVLVGVPDFTNLNTVSKPKYGFVYL